MHRHLLVLTIGLLLTGCVSHNHIQSQQRLTDGVAALQRAERAAQATLQARDDAAAFRAAEGDLLSVESHRLALAEDAEADLAAVDARLTRGDDADRISTLSRAALKGWQAGAAGETVAAAAAERGAPLCGASTALAATRDCVILSMAVPLNLLEIQADTILPYDALASSRRITAHGDPAITVTTLATAIGNIAETLPGLTMPPPDAPPGLAQWVGRQRALYLCTALAAEDALALIARSTIAASPDAQARRTALRGTPSAPGPLGGALAAFAADFPSVIDPTRLQRGRDDCTALFPQA